MRNKELTFKDPLRQLEGEFLVDMGCPDWTSTAQEPSPPQLHLGEHTGLLRRDLRLPTLGPLPLSLHTSLSFPAL